jgi:uncharacterized protein
MHTIVHMEVPADDVKRAREFYAKLFGWETKEAGPGMEYWLFSMGDNQPGGGMMKRMAPGQGITNYIGVPSVDEFSEKVKKLGGKVLMPKTAVAGMGYFAVCMDTEGNTFALWMMDKDAK